MVGLGWYVFFLARGRVHVPEFAVLTRVIALHERYLGAVRTPLDRLRSAPRDSSLGEDLFNREVVRCGGRCNVLGCGGLGAPRGKQKQQVGGEDEEKFFHERAPISHEV